MTALLVALGAGAGSAVRFALGTYVDRPGFPIGTWTANVVGSLVLGLLSGLGSGPQTLALLGVGLCGGFTTYSSFAVQTHGLLQGPGRWRGLAYAAATLVVSVVACALGFVLGHAA
jgi:CrcB protein